MKKATITAAVIFLAAFSFKASSQNAELMVDVGPCVAIQSAIQRFACYEAQAETALTGAGDSFQAPAPAARVQSQPPASRETAVSTPEPGNPPEEEAPPANNGSSPLSGFGFPEDRDSRREERENRLASVIADVEQTIPNQHIVTLENGQVWRQVQPEARILPRAGYTVSVYPSRWGSNYRMSFEEIKGFIQVERVR